MRVIVGCEFSQIVTKAFRDKGHEAYSCDLLPTEGNPEWHIQCDVLDILNDGWDLGIFHPPCTYTANSGVRWLFEDNSRWGKMIKACEFFNKLLKAKIYKICVENPIQHKYAKEQMFYNYAQIIQPWQFGHGESKAICLWMKNLPLLIPTKIMDKREQKVWKESPGPDRWKNRSRFYTGIAKAMAEQWG